MKEATETQKEGVLRYCLQFAMLKQLYDTQFLSSDEFINIKKKLMHDYHIVSVIET